MKRIARQKNDDIFLEKVQWNEVGEELNVMENKEDGNPMIRMIVGFVIVSAIFIYIGIGITKLQIIDGKKYLNASSKNYLIERSVPNNRGIIYDVNGVRLVENVASHRLLMRTYGVTSAGEERLKKEIEEILNFIPLEFDDVWQMYLDNKDNEFISETVVYGNIDYSTYLRIKVIEDSFEFFSVDENYARKYVAGNGFSHILGYTGEVTSTELLEKEGFKYGDIVGKEGLEFTYDEILRGEEGIDVREVDAMGKMMSNYVLEKEPPIDGADIYLSIDSNLQAKVYELLEAKVKELDGTAGSAVIVEVKTGKIVTLTNYPGYNNSLMVGGVSEDEVEEYMSMINDEKLPFLNRSIVSAQPPGSTFKVITASALLQSGAITTNTIINCPGIIYIGGDRVPIQDFGARVHGNLNVVGAIQMSSNIFFCRATIENSSIEGIMPYLEFYGIGEKTGVDLPGEAKGTFPSPDVKKKLAENNPWVDPYWYPQGDTCLTAFGQGIVTATPIQMAMVVTAIANGGKIYQPTLVDRIVYPDGTTETNQAKVLREGVVDESVLKIVGQGMKKSASNEGIVRVLANTSVPVAGKTGSAEYGIKDERGRYEHVHAWVIGFFPYDDPKYAVTILLEDGKAGGNAAYVLRDVVEYMYNEN